MASQKTDYKSLEDIRTYVRDFFVNGYKGFEDYHRERGVSKSTVRDRANTIRTVFGDIFNKQRGTNGYCRLVLDQSYPIRNPFHELYMYKSFTDKNIKRFFYAASILCTERLSKNAFVKMMEGIDKQKDSDSASSAMYLLADMLYDEGIVKRNARGKYSIADTSEIEALFAGKRFQAMLDFYSETAPFGVIGSFIREKLRTDGVSFRSKPLFMYRFRFPTQCLDSIVMYSILRAMQQKKAVHIESDDGSNFDCSPQRFFISRQSGREYLVYLPAESDTLQTIRLDKVTSAEITDADATLADLSETFWNPPFNINGSYEEVRCEVTSAYGADIAQFESERRYGEVTKANGAAQLCVKTNDTRNTLFCLKRYIGNITSLECDNAAERRRFMDDIDQTLTLYGES